jgi:hypothetical protein
MEYFAEKGQWHVKPTSSKLTTNACAYYDFYTIVDILLFLLIYNRGCTVYL